MRAVILLSPLCRTVLPVVSVVSCVACAETVVQCEWIFTSLCQSSPVESAHPLTDQQQQQRHTDTTDNTTIGRRVRAIHKRYGCIHVARILSSGRPVSIRSDRAYLERKLRPTELFRNESGMACAPHRSGNESDKCACIALCIY